MSKAVDELRAKAYDCWRSCGVRPGNNLAVYLDDAKRIVGEAFNEGVESVLTIRCMKHRAVPAYNSNEASGAECPACKVGELEAAKTSLLRIAKDALNVANGLTNYVESRPELRRAEREIEVIQRALKENKENQ